VLSRLAYSQHCWQQEYSPPAAAAAAAAAAAELRLHWCLPTPQRWRLSCCRCSWSIASSTTCKRWQQPLHDGSDSSSSSSRCMAVPSSLETTSLSHSPCTMCGDREVLVCAEYSRKVHPMLPLSRLARPRVEQSSIGSHHRVSGGCEGASQMDASAGHATPDMSCVVCLGVCCRRQDIAAYAAAVSTLDLRSPHTWYLYARAIKRKIIYHGGER
jgi:hypothetical protein